MPPDILLDLSFHQILGAHRDEWTEYPCKPAEQAAYQLNSYWSACGNGYTSRAHAQRSRDILAARLGDTLRVVRAQPGCGWRAPWLIISPTDPFAGRDLAPCEYAWCRLPTLAH